MKQIDVRYLTVVGFTELYKNYKYQDQIIEQAFQLVIINIRGIERGLFMDVYK